MQQQQRAKVLAQDFLFSRGLLPFPPRFPLSPQLSASVRPPLPPPPLPLPSTILFPRSSSFSLSSRLFFFVLPLPPGQPTLAHKFRPPPLPPPDDQQIGLAPPPPPSFRGIGTHILSCFPRRGLTASRPRGRRMKSGHIQAPPGTPFFPLARTSEGVC